ncbi:MAG: hypothetical protein ACN4GM_16715 [Gammaproteobacteria bacterium]
MSDKSSHQSLLSDLKQLYSQVTLSLFNKRMGLYHKDSHVVDGRDVSAKLSDQIEKLAAAEQAKASLKSQPIPSPEVSESVESDTASEATPTQSSRSKLSAVGRIVTALSSHFRGRSGNEMQPQISEKLKDSAWSHLHTALRHARQGELVTANLHADIACNALKEVAHYISDEEYTELSAEVDKVLEQIKQQN